MGLSPRPARTGSDCRYGAFEPTTCQAFYGRDARPAAQPRSDLVGHADGDWPADADAVARVTPASTLPAARRARRVWLGCTTPRLQHPTARNHGDVQWPGRTATRQIAARRRIAAAPATPRCQSRRRWRPGGALLPRPSGQPRQLRAERDPDADFFRYARRPGTRAGHRGRARRAAARSGRSRRDQRIEALARQTLGERAFERPDSGHREVRIEPTHGSDR